MGPNAVYNMPLALRLRGEVKVEALTQSLQEIVVRHEALRTRFEMHEERAVLPAQPRRRIFIGIGDDPVQPSIELLGMREKL